MSKKTGIGIGVAALAAGASVAAVAAKNHKKPENKTTKKNKSNSPIETKSILKFFGIAILIFGVLLIGTGVYAIYKNQSYQQEQNIEPTISIENKTENTIILKVTHKKNIARIEYWWNSQDRDIVNGNNGKYLEKEINIPSGKNTLHVLIVDEDGKEMTYEKQYELESNIHLEVSGNKIKITYEGNTTISYMTYRWDEEEEKTIEINDTNIDEEIEAIKGLHTLTVIVVDENNNTDTKQQKINGVSKPKVTVSVDEQQEHFVIQASDDEKLSKIEFRLNQDEEQEFELNLEEMDLKELRYVLPSELQLSEGENVIEVTVYNSNGVSEETGIVRFVK